MTFSVSCRKEVSAGMCFLFIKDTYSLQNCVLNAERLNKGLPDWNAWSPWHGLFFFFFFKTIREINFSLRIGTVA